MSAKVDDGSCFLEGGRPVKPRCKLCGCTDENCRVCIERTGEPCRWVSRDLCSACCISLGALELRAHYRTTGTGDVRVLVDVSGPDLETGAMTDARPRGTFAVTPAEWLALWAISNNHEVEICEGCGVVLDDERTGRVIDEDGIDLCEACAESCDKVCARCEDVLIDDVAHVCGGNIVHRGSE